MATKTQIEKCVSCRHNRVVATIPVPDCNIEIALCSTCVGDAMVELLAQLDTTDLLTMVAKIINDVADTRTITPTGR